MLLKRKFQFAFLGILSVFAIASCSKDFDKDAGYRTITSKLTLDTDYEGKNFIDDGIGKATVQKYTDGDTSTFKLETTSEMANKSTIVVRYHGIDTPESTIEVEKWGKTASLYTKKRLENASEIVLEATTKPASLDSNGTRYIGYVWYRESSSDTFKNLNLELVENGFSKATSPLAKYSAIFKEAQSFADEHDMHIWGNDEDPNYTEDPLEITLPEVVKDLESDTPTLYDSDIDAGAKVKFNAYIESHTSSNTHMYKVAAFDGDGKKYTFNVYGGYSSFQVNNILRVGDMVCFIGNVAKFNGEFQLSGLEYSIGGSNDKKVHVVEKGYYQIFDSNNSRFMVINEYNIQGDLTVTTATLNGTELTITGQALEKPATGSEGESKTYTIKCNVGADYDVNKLIGKSISTKGFKNADGSIKVELIDIVIR